MVHHKLPQLYYSIIVLSTKSKEKKYVGTFYFSNILQMYNYWRQVVAYLQIIVKLRCWIALFQISPIFYTFTRDPEPQPRRASREK